MARRAAAWMGASNDADGSTSHGSGLRPSTLATIAPTRSGGGGGGDGGSGGMSDGGSGGDGDDCSGGSDGRSESASGSSSANDAVALLPLLPPILKPQANQNCCAYSSNNQRAM